MAPIGTNLTSIVNANVFYNNYTDGSDGVSTTGLTYKITLYSGGLMPSNSSQITALSSLVKFTSANLFSSNMYSQTLGSTIGTGNLVTHSDINNSGGSVYNFTDYYIEGIKNVSDWNAVKISYSNLIPTVTKCSITGNNISRSWFVFNTAPYLLTNNGDTTYTANTGSQVVANVPTVSVASSITSSGYLDIAGIRWLYKDQFNYTITPLISSSVSNITVGSGNISSYTNSVTISGNINQIISSLNSNVSITPTTGYTDPIVLKHTLTGINSNVISSLSTVQVLSSGDSNYLMISPQATTYASTISGNIAVNFQQSNLTTPLLIDRGDSTVYELDMAIQHQHTFTGAGVYLNKSYWLGSLSFTGTISLFNVWGDGTYTTVNVLGTVNNTGGLPSSGTLNNAYIVKPQSGQSYPSLYVCTGPTSRTDWVTGYDSSIEANILNVSSTATDGTAGWELYYPKTYSIRGTISQINKRLQSITLSLAHGTTTNFNIRWSGIGAVKSQPLNFTS